MDYEILKLHRERNEWGGGAWVRPWQLSQWSIRKWPSLKETHLPHMRLLMWPLTPSWGGEVSRAEAQMGLYFTWMSRREQQWTSFGTGLRSELQSEVGCASSCVFVYFCSSSLMLTWVTCMWTLRLSHLQPADIWTMNEFPNMSCWREHFFIECKNKNRFVA